MTAPRVFVTGTDTDVGKTYVAARVAAHLRRMLPLAIPVTIVKPVQTGTLSQDSGDAALALAQAQRDVPEDLRLGLFALELRRFEKPADAYTAARFAGEPPPTSVELARELRDVPGALVVEGFGGAAAPLNHTETAGNIAAAAGLPALVVVALRLGCISHALLTKHYLDALGVEVLGAIVVDRWSLHDLDYKEDVTRCLRRAYTAVFEEADVSTVAAAIAAASMRGFQPGSNTMAPRSNRNGG